MDNCLSPTSQSGGLGCDNMTVIIVGLLNGKTKEEWYDMVAERVEKGDGPVAPPQFSQFRGPGFSYYRNDGTDSGPKWHTGEGHSGSGGEAMLHHLAQGLHNRIIQLGDGSNLFLNHKFPFHHNQNVEEVSGDEEEVGSHESHHGRHVTILKSAEDSEKEEEEQKKAEEKHKKEDSATKTPVSKQDSKGKV